jgi:hypothetical protein
LLGLDMISWLFRYSWWLLRSQSQHVDQTGTDLWSSATHIIQLIGIHLCEMWEPVLVRGPLWRVFGKTSLIISGRGWALWSLEWLGHLLARGYSMACNVGWWWLASFRCVMDWWARMSRRVLYPYWPPRATKAAGYSDTLDPTIHSIIILIRSREEDAWSAKEWLLEPALLALLSEAQGGVEMSGEKRLGYSAVQ